MLIYIINILRKWYYKEMKIRFIIYIIIVMIIFCLSWIFVLCFSSTYKNSSKMWIEGNKLAFIIDYLGIKLGIPLLKTLLRQLIKWTKLKFLIMIFRIWVYIMSMMKPKRVQF